MKERKKNRKQKNMYLKFETRLKTKHSFFLQPRTATRLTTPTRTGIRSRVLSARRSSTGNPRWSPTPCPCTLSIRRGSSGSNPSSMALTGSTRTRLPNRDRTLEKKRWRRMKRMRIARNEGDIRVLMIKVNKHAYFSVGGGVIH